MFENNTDKFDQHFLIDKYTIETFIKEANLSKEDVVVEIGPGKGQITSLIAPRVKKLVCIELDKRLEQYLKKIQNKYKNIDIIYGNVLEEYIPECNKIVTSLPYSIIEPFINKLLKCKFDEIIMIIGKKYADAVVNNELSKLSLLTNCYFKTKYIMDIPPEYFNPSPRVMSAMIKLIPIKENQIVDFNILVFRFLFYYRDKKVKNALIESLIRSFEIKNNPITKKTSKDIISSFELEEELLNKLFSTCSNNELAKLDRALKKIKIKGDN